MDTRGRVFNGEKEFIFECDPLVSVQFEDSVKTRVGKMACG